MPKSVHYLIAAVLFTVIAGCNAGLPPAEWANVPPSGAHIVHAPKLAVGDTWVYEKQKYGAENPYKKWEEKVLKILPKNEYLILYTDLTENKRYLLIKDKGLTTVAYMDGSPEGERVKLKQIVREVQFPLWVGRRWDNYITTRPYTTGHINNYHSFYTVTAVEKINLAGAVYEAFKIKRQDTMMAAGSFSGNAELWYVPELKCQGKFNLPGAVDQQLLKFTPGPQ